MIDLNDSNSLAIAKLHLETGIHKKSHLELQNSVKDPFARFSRNFQYGGYDVMYQIELFEIFFHQEIPFVNRDTQKNDA